MLKSCVIAQLAELFRAMTRVKMISLDLFGTFKHNFSEFLSFKKLMSFLFPAVSQSSLFFILVILFFWFVLIILIIFLTIFFLFIVTFDHARCVAAAYSFLLCIACHAMDNHRTMLLMLMSTNYHHHHQAFDWVPGWSAEWMQLSTVILLSVQCMYLAVLCPLMLDNCGHCERCVIRCCTSKSED